MEVQLSPDLEKAVDTALAGGFDSAEQYIAEAITNYYQLKINRLNAALAVGFEQLERGEGVEFSMEEIITELDSEDKDISFN